MKKLLPYLVFELPQIIITTLVFLYTLFGFVFVPMIIESKFQAYMLENYNETATVENIYFNPFIFSLELTNLKISEKRPIEEASPYKVQLNFLRINLDILPLLVKKVQLSEVILGNAKFSFALYDNQTNTWTSLIPAEAIENKEKAPSSPWTINLKKVDINNSYFHFADYNYPTMVNLPLGPISLKAHDITTVVGEKSKLDNLAIYFGDNGTLKFHGDLNLSPFSTNLEIEAQNFPLSFISGYLSKTTYLKLSEGKINLKSKLNYSPSEISFISDFDLLNFKLTSTKDESNIFSFEKMNFDNLNYSHSNNSLSINKINLIKPDTSILIRNDGTLNFKDLVIPAPPSDVKKEDTGKKLSYEIKEIALTEGNLNFKDSQIKPSFMADIENLSGSIGPITHTLDQKWNIALNGTVEGQGKFKTKGFMKPNDLKNELNLDVKFHNIEMTTFTPYSGHFAGYQIEKGKLFLDLVYSLKNNRIIGKNNVRFDHFTLGDKVDSKFATNLPVKLALALLKDRKGQIKFNLPVEGETNSPKFSLGNVIKTALVNMIVNIVSAPFDFISGMFAEGVDLKQFNFNPGLVTFADAEKNKLVALKNMLKERPDIQLEIQALSSLMEFPESRRKKITEDTLRELSMNRAKIIQDLLADEEISPERLYILNSKTYMDGSVHSEVIFNVTVN